MRRGLCQQHGGLSTRKTKWKPGSFLSGEAVNKLSLSASALWQQSIAESCSLAQ